MSEIAHYQEGIRTMIGEPSQWEAWGAGVLCSPEASIPPLYCRVWIQQLTRPLPPPSPPLRTRVPSTPKGETASHHHLHPGAWLVHWPVLVAEPPEPIDTEVHDGLVLAGLL